MVSAMKKIISTIMLLAASAAAFISCDKQNTVTTPSAEESVFVFTSEKPSFDDDVKTEWNEAENTVYWSDGDKIRMAYTITPDGGDPIWQGDKGANSVEDEPRLYASNGLGNSSLTASFTVPVSFSENSESPCLETGQYVFYTLYHSDCCSGTGFSAKGYGIVNIEIPATQSISKNSFDSKADIMVGKSVNEYDEMPTESVPVMWNRVVAHAYITLKDINNAVAGEIVNTITLTAQDGAQLVGNYTVNLTDGALESRSGGDAKNILNIKVDNKIATLTDNDFSFWASIKPCTLTSLKVVIDTDKATYTREIDLTGKEKTFLQNRRNLLKINMSEATREEKVVGETYTVISKVENLTPGTYYMGGNNQNKFSDSTTMYLWDGTVDGAELGIGSIVFTGQAFQSEPTSFAVITLESAGSENSYNIKVGDMYLNASGTTLSLSNTTFPWTVENLTGDKEGIVLVSNECKISINTTSCIKAYSKKYKGLYFFKKN